MRRSTAAPEIKAAAKVTAPHPFAESSPSKKSRAIRHSAIAESSTALAAACPEMMHRIKLPTNTAAVYGRDEAPVSAIPTNESAPEIFVPARMKPAAADAAKSAP